MRSSPVGAVGQRVPQGGAEGDGGGQVGGVQLLAHGDQAMRLEPGGQGDAFPPVPGEGSFVEGVEELLDHGQVTTPPERRHRHSFWRCRLLRRRLSPSPRTRPPPRSRTCAPACGPPAGPTCLRTPDGRSAPTPRSPPEQLTRRVEVPSGFSRFPGDFLPPPRAWLDRTARVTRLNEPARGGPFAPFEEPDLYATELPCRAGRGVGRQLTSSAMRSGSSAAARGGRSRRRTRLTAEWRPASRKPRAMPKAAPRTGELAKAAPPSRPRPSE